MKELTEALVGLVETVNNFISNNHSVKELEIDFHYVQAWDDGEDKASARTLVPFIRYKSK